MKKETSNNKIAPKKEIWAPMKRTLILINYVNRKFKSNQQNLIV